MNQVYEQLHKDMGFLIIAPLVILCIVLPAGLLLLELRDYYWRTEPLDIVNTVVISLILICGIGLTTSVIIAIRGNKSKVALGGKG